MTRRAQVFTAAEPVVVLVCDGCGHAVEPETSDHSDGHRRALLDGCPECGDWLYVGEIAPPNRERGARGTS